MNWQSKGRGAPLARWVAPGVLAGFAMLAIVAPSQTAARSPSPDAVARSIFANTEAGDWQLQFNITALEAKASENYERYAVLEFVAQLARENSRLYRTLPENGLKFHFAGSAFPGKGSCAFIDGRMVKERFALTARCSRADGVSVQYRWAGRVTPSELNADLNLTYRSRSGRSSVRATAQIWYERTYPCDDPRSPPCATTGPSLPEVEVEVENCGNPDTPPCATISSGPLPGISPAPGTPVNQRFAQSAAVEHGKGKTGGRPTIGQSVSVRLLEEFPLWRRGSAQFLGLVDERCPVDLDCARAGRVKLELRLAFGDRVERKRQLFWPRGFAGEGGPWLCELGRRVEVTGVSPDRRARVQVPSADFRIQVRLGTC